MQGGGDVWWILTLLGSNGMKDLKILLSCNVLVDLKALLGFNGLINLKHLGFNGLLVLLYSNGFVEVLGPNCFL